jgi:polar amino acid transport system permease protein
MTEIALQILSGLPATVGVTAAAMLLGIVLGLPLMAWRTSRFRPLRFVMIFLFAFVRSIPPIVWLFIVFFGFSGLISLTPFQAAVATFAATTAVYAAEIFRGSLNSIHRGQFEAAAALNLVRRDVFIYVTAPQLYRVSLPPLTAYMIGLFKDTAIASTIGVQEIAFQTMTVWQTMNSGIVTFLFAGAAYLSVSFAVAAIAVRLETAVKASVAR